MLSVKSMYGLLRLREHVVLTAHRLVEPELIRSSKEITSLDSLIEMLNSKGYLVSLFQYPDTCSASVSLKLPRKPIEFIGSARGRTLVEAVQNALEVPRKLEELKVAEMFGVGRLQTINPRKRVSIDDL